MSDITQELTDKISKSVQEEILGQLNYLVNRGLLEVQYGDLVLTNDATTNNVQVQRSVNLVLKDKEYVERLERENDKLIGENQRLKEMIQAMVGVASRNS